MQMSAWYSTHQLGKRLVYFNNSLINTVEPPLKETPNKGNFSIMNRITCPKTSLSYSANTFRTSEGHNEQNNLSQKLRYSEVPLYHYWLASYCVSASQGCVLLVTVCQSKAASSPTGPDGSPFSLFDYLQAAIAGYTRGAVDPSLPDVPQLARTLLMAVSAECSLPDNPQYAGYSLVPP